VVRVDDDLTFGELHAHDLLARGRRTR